VGASKTVNPFTPAADLPISQPTEVMTFMGALGHTSQLLAGSQKAAKQETLTLLRRLKLPERCHAGMPRAKHQNGQV